MAATVWRNRAGGRQLRGALRVEWLRGPRFRFRAQEALAKPAAAASRGRRRRILGRPCAGGRNAADQLRDVGLVAVAQVIQQVLARGPRSDGVDDGVPEALQRQHKGAHKLEDDADLVLVNDRVHAVGARRDPGDEDGREEEDGALGVRPRRVVELVVAAAVRVGLARHPARRLRPRGEAADGLRSRLDIRFGSGVLVALDRQFHFLKRLRRRGGLRIDVHRVRAVVVVLERRLGLRGNGRVTTKRRGPGLGGVDGLAGDGHLVGPHRVLVVAVDGHGVGVGGVKVTQLLALLVDCTPGAEVDEEGDDDDDPGVLSRVSISPAADDGGVKMAEGKTYQTGP